jgi:sugar phosphate isomerase/epimerase
MRLSLSVRIAESSSRKDRAEMPLEDLAPLAHAAGFEGLSMRASALSVDSAPDAVAAVRRLLDHERLAVSMVMGNVALAANSPDAPDCLRHITPHLDLAEHLGASLIRVMLQHSEDIEAAQHAADEAAERGMTIAQQTHWGTLCETVEDALDLVGRVDRPNFGITLEPANLLACGDARGEEAVRRLAPHLVNFYFQNVRLDPAGPHRFKTRCRGDVAIKYLSLDDPEGIPVAPLIAALADVGYDKWVTVHQPLRDGQTVPQAIDEAARVFRPLVAAAGGNQPV